MAAPHDYRDVQPGRSDAGKLPRQLTGISGRRPRVPAAALRASWKRVEQGGPVALEWAMDELSEKQKMLAGLPYRASDPEIAADQAAAAEWMHRFNTALAAAPAEREALLRERFAHVGRGSTVRPPFHCDYGFNIRLGEGVFLNFNCVILDVVEVRIGDGTQIGPAVQILTADHPRDAAERASGIEWGKPIRIGRNVWIGAGAVILPGVTIGDDAVIGAACVVTKDVPPGATVVGNPARVRPA